MINKDELRQYIAANHGLIVNENDPMLQALLSFEPLLDQHAEQLLGSQQELLENFKNLVTEREKSHAESTKNLLEVFRRDLKALLKEQNGERRAIDVGFMAETLKQQNQMIQNIVFAAYLFLGVGVVLTVGLLIAWSM